MILRPYQQACRDGNAKAFEEFDRVLDVLPTGSGKTIIFSNETQRRNDAGERVLILADRDKLVNQAIEKLHLSTGIKAEKEKAEEYASLDAEVVVGSVQTMSRRFNRWPEDHFDLIICDECDLSLSASWQSVLNYFDGCAQVLGVTATPNRADKKSLGQYYQTIGYEISLFELINQGYLSPIVIKSVPLKIDINSVSSKGGDFDSGELGNAIEPYLDQIAQSIKIHARNRRTIAFLPLIATSKKFVEACARVGLHAGHVDGEMDGVDEVLKAFERDEFQILSNSQLLNRGYDVDSEVTGIGIDCVANLCPTKSQALYSQRIGRGTRTALFKDNLLVLDFLWTHESLPICSPANLVSHDDDEVSLVSKQINGGGIPGDIASELPELDLQIAFSCAQEERLAKELEAKKHRSETTISPEQMASMFHDAEISHFDPVMQSEQRPITDNQMKWLKKTKIDSAGMVYLYGNAPKGSKPIDISQIKGEAHASKILSHLFSSKNKGVAKASPSQRALMHRMGHENAMEATADEARKFFADLNQKKKERQETLI